jgi:hypothetical protein
MGEGLREVTPTMAIQPGELCFVCFSGERNSPWAALVAKHTSQRYVGVVKIYLGRVDDVILLGQLIPPLVAPVHADDVIAMHRICEPLRATAQHREGLKLMRSFMGDTHEPINPDWRPQPLEQAA